MKLPFGKAHFPLVLDAVPVGIVVVDSRGTIDYANSGALRLLGWEESELVGQHINAVIPDRYHTSHEQNRSAYHERGKPRLMGEQTSLTAKKKNGDEVPVEIGLTPIRLEGEKYIICTIQDVSDRVKVEKYKQVNTELSFIANHDNLTQLANSAQTLRMIKQLNQNPSSANPWLVIAFIDLNGFKSVNDSFGHAIGDKLLIKVADNIRSSIRNTDIAGRYGGDEFLVCLSKISDASHVEGILSNLADKISSIHDIDSRTVNIGASIGAVAFKAAAENDIDAIIRRADELMYAAKKDGGKNLKYIILESN